MTGVAKQQACLELAKIKPGVLYIAWFTDTCRLYKELLAKEG